MEKKMLELIEWHQWEWREISYVELTGLADLLAVVRLREGE